MRIAESHLRRIIADESKKFKRGKRVNEAMSAFANEDLNNALYKWYSAMSEELGHERALDELQNEVMGFIEEYR
jgi:hypothetical protein